MNKEIVYDIIIPVGRKDVNFVPRVVDLITRCLSGIEHIYIFTHQKYISVINKKIGKYTQCMVLDENELLPGSDFAKVRDIICQHAPQHVNMTGWYFQQFLKLGFALSRYSKQYYLSWDADTLPLAPIKFFDGDNILFNPKQENHIAYFETINRILGFGKQVEVSYISESMMFSVAIVKEMISKIDNTDNQSGWIEKIINACNFEKSPQSFSEFETYGNYCARYYPGLYKPRHLNTFREAGLIRGRYIREKQLREMSFDLDMASFELHNRPCFPYNIPNITWTMNNKFSKMKALSFREIIEKFLCKLSGKNNMEENLYRLPDRPVGGGKYIVICSIRYAAQCETYRTAA